VAEFSRVDISAQSSDQFQQLLSVVCFAAQFEDLCLHCMDLFECFEAVRVGTEDFAGFTARQHGRQKRDQQADH
jgi:hypothetical protein